MPQKRLGEQQTREISNGGAFTVEESGLHINIQELKARRLGLRFTLKVKSIHVKTNNMTALSYLVKKGERSARS